MFLEVQPGYHPKGAPPVTPTLTLPEFEARWRTWLLDEYHQRVHSETGQTPHARWTAGGWLPRLPESLEQLDLLLLTVATSRWVQQDGIRFRGLRYLDLTLAGYVGEDVTIRYDPRDMAEIRVYYQDRFLCRAICQEIAGQTISLKEIIAARTACCRSVRTHLTERQQAVEWLLEVHKAPPEPPAPPLDPELPRLRRYFNE
jgi:putative transposase